MHSKGLLLGIYSALGNGTCAMGGTRGLPRGTGKNLGLGCDASSLPGCAVAERDINDFVSWGIDALKVDGCFEFDNAHMNLGYARVGQLLRAATAKTGRPVLYNPSNLGFKLPREIREYQAVGAGMWRWFDDVVDSWFPTSTATNPDVSGASVSEIIEAIGAGQPTCLPGLLPPACDIFMTDVQHHPIATICASYCSEVHKYLTVTRPGTFPDADMLIVGNSPCPGAKGGNHCHKLTHDEEQTQMAIWALAAAPLFMSTDLRHVPASSKAILLNRELLQISQDPLARAGHRFYHDLPTGGSGWVRELQGGDIAVALHNGGGNCSAPTWSKPVPPRCTGNQPLSITLDSQMVDFAPGTAMAIFDVYANASLGVHTGSFVSKLIPPHGVQLLRIAFSPVY